MIRNLRFRREQLADNMSRTINNCITTGKQLLRSNLSAASSTGVESASAAVPPPPGAGVGQFDSLPGRRSRRPPVGRRSWASTAPPTAPDGC